MPWKLDQGLYQNGTGGRSVPWFSPTWLVYADFGKLAYVAAPAPGGSYGCSIPAGGSTTAAGNPIMLGPVEYRWMTMVEIARRQALQWIVRHYTWDGVLETLKVLPRTYVDDADGLVKPVGVVEVAYRQTAVTATMSWVPPVVP